MSKPDICFEDLVPGTVETYGDRLIDTGEIKTFAAEFDPQQFHLDETAAAASPFARGLLASGWHTNALINRINCDQFLRRSSCMGSPGVDEIKWLRPVRPGDRLSVRREIRDRRVWRSKPDRGTVQFTYDLHNQQGEHLARHDCKVIFGLRHPGSLAPDESAARIPISPDIPAIPSDELPIFADLPIGTAWAIGDYTFTDENIAAFASAYDNQDFHIDAAAAAKGPFGGIIASGWHTAAAWMACLVRNQTDRFDRLQAAGRNPAVTDLSPGLKNMRWLRPVRPGDTLTYECKVIGKRETASRPEWGLVFHHNTGTNQRGERAFEFTGAVFWERRQP